MLKKILKKIKKIRLAQSTSQIILISLFISLTIGFFAPSQIYLTNQSEFSFIYQEVVPLFLLLSLIIFLFIFLILFTLSKFKNKRIFKISLSLVFILGFLLWLQGNIIVWDYGIFDGTPIEWSKYTNRNYLDGFIWLSLIVFTIVKYKFINKISKKISILLIIMQLLYTVILFIQAPEPPSYQKYTIDETNKFNFSKDKNVIVLLLDSVRSDIFYEILKEDKKYEEMLDGFTYFPDTLSGYPVTYLSVPLITTGLYYKNEEPISEFIKKSFSTNSIFKAMKDNGYITEFYLSIAPEYASYYFDDKIIDNLVSKEKLKFNLNVIKNNELFNLLDITLFRSSLSCIKPYIYNNQDWLLSRIFMNIYTGTSGTSTNYNLKTLDFVNSLDNLNSQRTGPVFKYYHLPGAHPPFKLTKNLKMSEKRLEGIEGYLSQVKANLTLLKHFFSSLKKKGLYKSSFIIILADHGIDIIDKKFPTKIDYNLRLSQNFVDKKVLTRALPLLLIKPPNSSKDFKISNVTASLQDISKTILDNLEIVNDFSGINLLDSRKFSTKNSRKRLFYYYNWILTGKDKGYLPALEEYEVVGDGWNGLSWEPIKAIYTKEKKISINSRLNLDQKVLFGKEGNSLGFQLGGWSAPEDGFTWTDSKIASLVFPGNYDFDLKMQVKITKSFNNNQLVLIYVNDDLIEEWVIDEEGVYEVNIPNRYLDKERIYISFHFPNANYSYHDLDRLNPDTRKLGALFEYIVFKK